MPIASARRIAAAIMLPALVACAAQVPAALVYNTDFDPAFSAPGAVPLGGVVPVELHGSPPAGLSGADFAALMRAPGWYPPTRFRPAPAGGADEGVRVVAAFGTDSAVALCTRPMAGGDPRLVAMALCLGRRQVSRAALRMAAGDPGPQVDLLMRGLLPPPRPDDSGPCLRRIGC